MTWDGKMTKRSELPLARWQTSRLGKPEIVVSHNNVMICGQYITRPQSISVSQWLGYWEKVMGL